MRQVWSLVVLVGLVGVGCQAPPTPVLLEAGEKVIGRARDATRVRLLTTSGRLITVQRSDRSTSSEVLHGLTSGETPWGLAVGGEGRWWTLVGSSHLAEIDERGGVVGRVALGGRYVGLFDLQGEILLQPAALAPGEPVLQRLNLDTMGVQNTGSLRASSFDTRAETLAFNLVTCGSGDATELPCWLNHGRRVDRVGWTRDGRQQVLSGLGLPRDGRRGLEGVETVGPIIDAHIDSRGRLWVLVRRPAEADGEESVVARYSLEDGLEGSVVVSSQSRLIIDAHDSDCVLLAGAGQFITVGIP